MHPPPVWWLPAAAALGWLLALLLPWRPWSTREHLDAVPDSPDAAPPRPEPGLSQVTAVMPARNEADLLVRTLPALAAQEDLSGERVRILLVDDQSADDTCNLVSDLHLDGLEVLAGTAPPSGWSGKLWALEQGCREARTKYLLFLDADIKLAPLLLGRMLEKMQRERLDFVSLMARLRMENPWERLCMPAFVYFFKLLYPFALANHAGNRVAAAAGGCILLRAELLQRAGGLAGVRGALIDDCALARACKQAGGRTWIGLTRSAVSLRRYPGPASIWTMVARTAFAQLHHSLVLLALCCALLITALVVPVLGLGAATPAVRGCSGAALLFMGIGYLPLLRYYRLPAWRALTLPLAGTLFLAMTLDSARRHLLGGGVEWKGRRYRAAGPAQT